MRSLNTRCFSIVWKRCSALAFNSAIVTDINANAEHRFHTIQKHLVFKERILHGFATTDVMPSYPTPPTFPMWGYGWVLLLTTNRAVLSGLHMRVAPCACAGRFRRIGRAWGL